MNPRELEVLNIVCAADNPVTSSDIVREQRDLTQSTVIAVLRKLVAEGLVEISGVTHSGRVLSRTYIPGKKVKELMKDYYEKQLAKTKDILSADDIREVVGRVYKKA